MTPELMARLVARWVRRYTRGLPEAVARRRAEEIAADVHDHIGHERAAGTGERRIALAIASRMLRGIPADRAWRSRHADAAGGRVRGSVARAGRWTAAILVIPGVATLLGMAWGPLDFALAAAVLMAAGVAVDLARQAGDGAYRAAAGVALAAALLLLWLVASAGAVAETGDPADLMHLAVLALGIAGAVRARLRPRGMARTMAAMALAEGVVVAVALALGRHDDPATSVAEIAGVGGVFAALFLTSAWLFRRAAAGPAGGPARPGARTG